jgi:glycosyltransferase involved in cell wall biosynthesis
MKIAVWHNLNSGGGKRALYHHVKGLVERGHTIECWCPPTADSSYLPLGSLAPEHVRPLVLPTMPKRPLSATFAGARMLCRRLGALEDHARQCAREIESRGFDLIFANACVFAGTPPIARHTRLPSLLYLGEPHRPLYEALPELPWLAQPQRGRISLRTLVRFCTDYVRVRALRIQAREEVVSARAFTSILVNSLFSRESVIRAYGIEATVCYLGIDTDLFVDRGMPREEFVVGVGSFTPPKRIDFVIRALARLPQRQRRLVWIGNIADQAYLSELTSLAQQMKVTLDARIGIKDDEVVCLLNRAAVMAYAPRLEPFGLAPLEANACGTPVVAVAEGGVRETIVHGENGLLCEPDPAAMAAAVSSLLSDSEFRRHVGARARKVVEERWSTVAAIDRLESRLSATLERHSQRPRNLTGVDAMR